jgi:hypothetical protein
MRPAMSGEPVVNSCKPGKQPIEGSAGETPGNCRACDASDLFRDLWLFSRREKLSKAEGHGRTA